MQSQHIFKIFVSYKMLKPFPALLLWLRCGLQVTVHSLVVLSLLCFPFSLVVADWALPATHFCGLGVLMGMSFII